VGSHSSVG